MWRCSVVFGLKARAGSWDKNLAVGSASGGHERRGCAALPVNVSSECGFFLSQCIKYVQWCIGHSLDTALG